MRRQREPPDPLEWMNKFYEFINDPNDDTVSVLLLAHHDLRKSIIEYYARLITPSDRADVFRPVTDIT